MLGSPRYLWKLPFLELFGSGRFVGLLLAVIIFDVAPAPGENYSRCGGSEQTALVDLEIVADETELYVGASMVLDAKGTWENEDSDTVEHAQWSVEPEGIVELEPHTASYAQGRATITGLSEGVATITAVSEGIEASLEITVLPVD